MAVNAGWDGRLRDFRGGLLMSSTFRAGLRRARLHLLLVLSDAGAMVEELCDAEYLSDLACELLGRYIADNDHLDRIMIHWIFTSRMRNISPIQIFDKDQVAKEIGSHGE